MSMITSFYLFPDSKREDVVRAAVNQGKALKKQFGIFPPKLPLNPDPFWDFMSKEARELEQLPYSGFLIVDLEMIANGLLDSTDFVGTKLCEITDTTFFSHTNNEAAIVLKKLGQLKLEEELIKQHLEEDERMDEYPDIVKPLNDCINILKIWFSEVEEGQTGILNIC